MDKKHRVKEERLSPGRGRRRAAAGHTQEEMTGGGGEGHDTVLGSPAATEVTGVGGRQGQAGWAHRGRAHRLLQGPEEALARRREEERRGALGHRGRWGWSPAGVGAAASGQRKTTAAAAAPTACRRGGRRGRSKGAAAYVWGRVGDLAREGGTGRKRACSPGS